MLNLTSTGVYNCLSGGNNQYKNHILKFEEEVSEENIEKWCETVFWALDGTKKCSSCKEWFNVEDIYRCICKPCYSRCQLELRSILDGFLKYLAYGMKSSAIERKNKGHDNKGTCDLKYTDLLNIYNSQQGKCYYTGIKMETKPLSSWQASCERLNESKGYTVDNTKLICLEFNVGHNQWSLDKINKIPSLRNIIVDIDELRKLVSIAEKNSRKSIYSRRKTKIKNGIINYQCVKCLLFLPIDKYLVRKNRSFNHCIDCDKICIEEYNNSLKGFIINLLKDAKRHASTRSTKRSDECRIFTLTLNDLLDKIISQKGRCYYSDIPLVFKSNCDWKTSIERVNNKLGYTKENTVLICVEFNSFDNTVITKNEIHGSSQWSKDKFNQLLKHINNKSD